MVGVGLILVITVTTDIFVGTVNGAAGTHAVGPVQTVTRAAGTLIPSPYTFAVRERSAVGLVAVL